MPKGAPASHKTAVHGNNTPRKKRGIGAPLSKKTKKAVEKSRDRLDDVLAKIEKGDTTIFPAVVLKVSGGGRFSVKSLKDATEHSVRLGGSLKIKKKDAREGQVDVAVSVGTVVLTDGGDILAIVPKRREATLLGKLGTIREEEGGNNFFNRTKGSPKSTRSNKSSKSSSSNFSFSSSRRTRRNRH